MTSNTLPPKPSRPQTVSRVLGRMQRFLKQHRKLAITAGSAGLLLIVGIPIARVQLNDPTATPAKTSEARALPVETMTVSAVDGYEVSRSYTGEIAALRSSELGFERGGQLVEVLVQEGDRVSVGQPLARLDTSNLQTQRQQRVAEKAAAQARLRELRAGPRPEDIAAAEATVRDLEQQLRLQQTQRSRREFLYNEGAISKEQLDEFTFTQRSLQARLDRARSELQELRNGTRVEQIDAQAAQVEQLEASIANLDVTLRKSTLNAPFDGIVSTRQVDEGTVVSAGQSVIRLVEDAAAEARIGIPSKIAESLQIGSTETVKLESGSYRATVTSMLPEVDPDTRTQVVVFTLNPSAIGRVNPGQTARVDLTETIDAEGFWLPTDALTQGIRGLWTCYALEPASVNSSESGVYQLRQQSVEILHQEGNRVLVRGTLQEGDRVVASGIHRLVPGQKVRPVEAITP